MENISKKYFEGQATEAEQLQLLEWLRSRRNRMAFVRYKLDWEKSLGSEQIPGGGEESWNRLQAELMQRGYERWQKSRRLYQITRMAAIFFLLISLGSAAYFILNGEDSVTEVFTSVVTENGQISKVELPDGSLVWLNSGSKISYSNLFATENRNIQLIGEAYFDVATNVALPLVVNCRNLEIKALGTNFNVNGYSEHSVEVVLEEGIVELSNVFSEKPFHQLSPGELIEVNIKENSFTTTTVDPLRYTSWKEGVLNIYNMPVEEVVKRLERRFNQQFDLDPEVMQLNYTFTIKNESLEEILTLMEKISPVKVERSDNKILIKADKSKMRKTVR